jgi:hypothetical protein
MADALADESSPSAIERTLDRVRPMRMCNVAAVWSAARIEQGSKGRSLPCAACRAVALRFQYSALTTRFHAQRRPACSQSFAGVVGSRLCHQPPQTSERSLSRRVLTFASPTHPCLNRQGFLFGQWILCGGGDCATDTNDVDIRNMLTQVRSRRAAVNDCILVLERPAAIRGPGRGHPPKWN